MPYKGYQGEEQFVDIPRGASVGEIGRRLEDAGIVRDAFVYRIAVWRSGRGQHLKAGEYRFTEPTSVADVIDRLARGDVYVRRITFPEGLTIAEMGEVFASHGFGAATAFVEAAQDHQLVDDLDARATDLEGYLFPATYALSRRADAPTLVRMMVERFRATYTHDLQTRAHEQGLSTRQVLTLAALVEKETGSDSERPLVAAVYRNRMKIGMAMQADPTLIYALTKARRYDGNIRKTDFAFDSPYNTYKYSGLPPGPIASPGKASLLAALSPATVPFLYFVSRNDGTHVFAETLAVHNANVHKYQVLYFRKQALAKKAQMAGRPSGLRRRDGH
jgi:UPF0755 protein